MPSDSDILSGSDPIGLRFWNIAGVWTAGGPPRRVRSSLSSVQMRPACRRPPIRSRAPTAGAVPAERPLNCKAQETRKSGGLAEDLARENLLQLSPDGAARRVGRGTHPPVAPCNTSSRAGFVSETFSPDDPSIPASALGKVKRIGVAKSREEARLPCAQHNIEPDPCARSPVAVPSPGMPRSRAE
jgi:hypothetical protein